MTESSISVSVFRQGLLAAGERMFEQRDALTALDAAAGDGDLGVTLATGFAYVREAIEDTAADDAGQLLIETGTQLGRKAPSTIGALLATAFMRAGATLHGATDLGTADIRVMLQVAFDGVAERGGATLGQRTILDAMDGAVKAVADAERRDVGVLDALHSAAAGAMSGADSTAEMEPVFGRAAWIADRARGTRDAGAVAWAVYLDGLAKGCAAASLEEAVSDSS